MTFIFTPNTLIESAKVNANFAELATNDLSLGKIVNRQDDTTNSVVSNQLIQFGWGWKLGDGVNRQISEAVTFPIAYDTAPIVIANTIGYKANSDPTAITDCTGYTVNIVSDPTLITTSQYTVAIKRMSYDGADPGATVNTSRYMYSWVAIGTKAR
jgi:hypothetical protein